MVNGHIPSSVKSKSVSEQRDLGMGSVGYRLPSPAKQTSRPSVTVIGNNSASFSLKCNSRGCKHVTVFGHECHERKST